LTPTTTTAAGREEDMGVYIRDTGAIDSEKLEFSEKN